jgi:hypothetical protein
MNKAGKQLKGLKLSSPNIKISTGLSGLDSEWGNYLEKRKT